MRRQKILCISTIALVILIWWLVPVNAETGCGSTIVITVPRCEWTETLYLGPEDNGRTLNLTVPCCKGRLYITISPEGYRVVFWQ